MNTNILEFFQICISVTLTFFQEDGLTFFAWFEFEFELQNCAQNSTFHSLKN